MKPLAIALLLCSCVKQPPPVPAQQNVMQIDPTWLGFTTCTDGQSASWINTRIVGTPNEVTTIAHEKKHIEQQARFPNCEIAIAAYHAAVILFEAEAFCEEVKIEQNPPYSLSYDEAKNKYIRWLSGGYGFSADSASKTISRFC